MADEQELRAMLADTQAQLRASMAEAVTQQVRAEKADAHVAELLALTAIPQHGDAPINAPPAAPQIPVETGVSTSTDVSLIVPVEAAADASA